MKDKQQMQCNCGGGKGRTHSVGDSECYREIALPPRKISCEKDRWFVDGHNITGTTLRQQRGYSQHPCGTWSRPKNGDSYNSLDTV